MLALLGMRSRVISLESKCLLRFLKLSAGPNRLSNYPYGKTVTVSNPSSLQFTASVHTSISNPFPNVSELYEARRFIHVAETRHDTFASENDEKLKKAKEAVQKEHKEAKPTGLFAKLKYYLKRYWYIAIPIHIANYVVWFIVFYVAVKSGLDVVALLEKCRIPNYVVDRVKSVPPNAGVAVVAFLLCKIAAPFRYATTLLLIQLSFPILRRFGLMTAKEVKYKMRLKYTNKVWKIKRRYQLKFNRMGSPVNKKRQSASGFKKS
ncbi:unnamed protein product [Cercopithifilaria johnstoni]|uniref:DUF1279 domain-containing protein n=1 Tax=Cercopithifilaria johnstoni TaxID=2874296 RepID=A0A8J2MG96_9BILA|nr:unnamed protein product [Cercopithifilaria johnstoni]